MTRTGLAIILGHGGTSHTTGTSMYAWERISGSVAFPLMKAAISYKYWTVIRNIYTEFGISDRDISKFWRQYRNFIWRWTVTYPYRMKIYIGIRRGRVWRYKLKWIRRCNTVYTWWWRDVRKELLLKTRKEVKR